MKNKEQKMLKRVVVSINEYSEKWPTGEGGKPLVEVIGWFEEKLGKIPEKYKSSAICEINKEYYDDDVKCVQIEIFYFSPVTNREVDWEEQIARKRAMLERTKARKKLREINELFPDLPDWED